MVSNLLAVIFFYFSNSKLVSVCRKIISVHRTILARIPHAFSNIDVFNYGIQLVSMYSICILITNRQIIPDYNKFIILMSSPNVEIMTLAQPACVRDHRNRCYSNSIYIYLYSLTGIR